MKGLMIGCAVVLAVGVVILFAGGYFLFGNVKTMVEGIEDSGKTFNELEEKFPFTPPEDWVILADRFDVYLASRSQVASALVDFTTDLEEESNWKKPMKVISSIPDLVRKTTEILTENEMSLEEFRWYSREVSLVLRLVDADPEQYPEFEELVKVNRKASDPGNNIWIGAQAGKKKPGPMEPHLDPRRIIIPAQNIDIVQSKIASLLDSAEAAQITAMFDFTAEDWN